MLFGLIGRTGPAMRHVVGFGDRSTGRVLLGANLVRAIVTNGGLYGVRVLQCRNEALFPNYFGQTCFDTLGLRSEHLINVKNYNNNN